MKIFISLLALLNGGYMLFDGIYVMLMGKYFGPEKPGPWAEIFYKLNVDVFNLGLLFIFYGLLWLTWLFTFLSHKGFAFHFGIIISILTVWYLPVGTLFSVIIFILLITKRKKLFI